MSTTVSLHLSTQAIMREIYAASALRCFQNLDEVTRPPLLTSDRQEALQLLVKDSFSHVVLRLLHHVETCDIEGVEEDSGVGTDKILMIELRVPSGFPSSATVTLRHAVEHAIAMDALHLCYMGHDEKLSERHGELTDETIETIHHLLRSIDCPKATIALNWL